MWAMEADIRVNTVNCVGVMGKGVALEFKRRYPNMFKRYRAMCQRGEIVPGSMDIYHALDCIIINFPTKRHWREQSEYHYIEDGLYSLRQHLSMIGPGLLTVIPPLGCGNGGLDWEIVRDIIKRYLNPLQGCDILVFRPI